MTVTLLRPYSGFATGAVVTFPDVTESALISQGFATASTASAMTALTGNEAFVTQGGLVGQVPNFGYGTPAAIQGPTIVPNIPLIAFASAGTSTAQVSGTLNIAEIFVPALNTFKGIAILNGATVGTDNLLVALYSTNGTLLANSAVAGALSAGANAFQKFDFLTAFTAMPGRYFVAVQCNGTTATTRRLNAANSPNVLTTSVAGTFGTLPATITVPTTFTDVVGPIAQLYTV